MRYSATTGCFYPEWVDYKELPADIVTLPDSDLDLAVSRGPNQRVTLVNGRIALEEVIPPLAEIKSEIWERIKAERDRRMNGGFKVETSAGVFKWYHSDPSSRTQHLGLMLAGAAIPPIEWKTMDGTFVPMTQEIIVKVFQAALALDAALFNRAEQHKAAMEASTDPASYDFSTGWPENFHGL